MTHRLGGHTVTVVRPPGNDSFGDPLPGDGDETEVRGAFMQPASTRERTDDRDTVVSDWKCFLPPTADIRATDRIRWRDHEYEVDGAPEPYDDLRGTTRHIEVQLRRVTG
ncbi:head-tail adaptor protein [Streptomyces kebangsaanensis]|uniref:hypothetical protein n=1 Tax=Streptomyces kebangsaanensis TaxID=864058 RepID=UPI00093ABD79|nr:hypothetical protein [Streptomyces kebangsaanensis]